MTDTKMIISKETWNNLSGIEREWILYNTMQEIDVRLKKLEDKAFFHKALAFFGGILGGIVGFFGSKTIN